MYEERFEHLLESWKKAFGQYRSSKTKAEQAVVRWEWTTGERYNVLPFHFIRFPGRGRTLKERPNTVGDFIQYGFDKEGRVQLQRYYQFHPVRPANFLDKLIPHTGLFTSIYSETFFRYSTNLVESIEFSVSPHIPLSIQRIFFDNGRVIFFERFKLNGYTPLYGTKGKNPDELYTWLGYNGRFKTVEEYIYDENRLKKILVYYEAPGSSPTNACEEFAYDEAGKLRLIDRVLENGQKQAVYRRRKKGQTFQGIRSEATQKLVQAIVQRIRSANIQEPVYCIELSYQQVLQCFPPFIIPVPESYRLQIMQSGDPAARFRIFVPDFDRSWLLSIDDPETLEICQVLEQEIRASEKWDTATNILRDAAAALTHYDWGDILTVTPDFVVFALDPELEAGQLVDSLGRSVSKKQIQEWMDKGWLD